ncbi:MAG TPA: OsmC family protein [Rhodothermales bacterium]
MSPSEIKSAFERNVRAIEARPSIGRKTAQTRVTVRDGTTCEIEAAHWKFLCDVGTLQGGNDAGPGPGILERGALGACLAIGYVTWAAVMDVPLEHVEVLVEADFDAAGQYGIGDATPGWNEIRYTVIVQSSATEEDVMRVIEKADRLSPVRDDFARGIPTHRLVQYTPIAAPEPAGS